MMIAMQQRSGDIERQLLEEQVRLSFRQLPFVVFVPLVSGAILTALLWGLVDHRFILTWLLLVFIGSTVAGSVILYRYYHNGAQTSAREWNGRLVQTALLSASAWGLGGYVLFTPDSHTHLGLLLLWMYIPAATGAMISIANRTLFFAIMLPMLVPVALRLIIEADYFLLLLALATVIYMGCLAYFHGHMHGMLMSSLRLRLEKEALIEELTRSKEAAELANQAKSRFLAAASHDLRQPLHAQTLFIAELKHSITEPVARVVLENLEASVESMGSLFSSLLEISRLDAGTIQRDLQEVPLSYLCQRLQAEFAGVAANRGLILRISECPHMVKSDPVLLICILRNLLDNALRHTESGTVMLCCRRSGGNIRIEIRDSGLGIHSDNHKAVFQEFFQLNNRERDRRKGLGLGLAIVARLGKLLDHDIGIRSAPGKGSVFSVTLPVSPLETALDKAQRLKLEEVPDISGVRALVIDNESSIVDGMRGLLGTWGCEVMSAPDLSSACDQLSKHPFSPDVILSDYRLPGSNTGIDTIAGLRQHLARPVPGILVTGDTAAEVLREADAHDISVIHKPVMPEELRFLISESVASAG